MKCVPLLLLLCLFLGASTVAQPLSLSDPDPEAFGFSGRDEPAQDLGNARDMTEEAYAFLETLTPHETYFVQEPIRLRLRFGYDTRFFKTHVIQLFRRHLDVPVQLQASWIEDLPGTVPLVGESDAPGKESDREHLSFALNDGMAEALRVEDRIVDNRRFTVLEIQRSYLPTRAGELVIPEPALHFTYAKRFHEDLVSGRVAADRHDALVSGKRLTLRIQPLPEEGRPPEFTGAVGRFSMQAKADPLDLRVGESLKLELRIEGEGNLAFFDAPRLDRLEGFHFFGSIEDKGNRRRTITYDLAPLSEAVREVPPIAFAYFDTTPPAAYRMVQTRPIPIEVRPLPEGARLAPLPGDEAGRAVPGETDIFDLKPVAGLPQVGASRRLSTALLVSVLLIPWLVALGLLFWMRARERKARDPDGVRARGAAAAFRARAGRPGTDPAKAFAEFLAARLRCPTAAVIAPDLPARLAAAGVPAELAARAATLLAGLGAARYGGSASADSAEAVRTLVDTLEVSFQTLGRTP